MSPDPLPALLLGAVGVLAEVMDASPHNMEKGPSLERFSMRLISFWETSRPLGKKVSRPRTKA